MSKYNIFASFSEVNTTNRKNRLNNNIDLACSIYYSENRFYFDSFINQHSIWKKNLLVKDKFILIQINHYSSVNLNLKYNKPKEADKFRLVDKLILFLESH